MANESIRIRTTPGVDKNIRVRIDQDFDFLEVLSLKITQEDLYQSFCSNYGVVVGRVIANKGFGVPNAKVSVFIPITNEDTKNGLIKDLYPYKSPSQKNSDGVRYNLLLSKEGCILNTPVGTFPSKEQVLDNDIVLEIFEKYYKYTTKTNDSGDFMIFGVPLGQQQIHVDVDLSDIGSLSIRPYDLIVNGVPERLFASKTQFKTSPNLDSLVQINSFDTSVDVIPFWGDPETCEIGITRVDFNLKTDINSTAIFFGSIFTDSGKENLNKSCNPGNDMGQQDRLKTGSGTISMIRVSEIDPNNWANGTITPVNLENFDIDGGELIDDNGTFAFLLPMNIGQVITDEFGILQPSPDPTIGIATKGMYRFKMKFNEPEEPQKFRTASLLFPSLGPDFGGTSGMVSTGSLAQANGTEDQRFTDDINQYDTNQFPNASIEKDFHLFEWKQLYTIAHFIKKYKKGGNRFSFLGVKNTDTSDIINPFPFNTAILKADFLYTLLSLFIDIISIFLKLLVVLASFSVIFCLRIKFRLPPIQIDIPIKFTVFKTDFDFSVSETISPWPDPILNDVICFTFSPFATILPQDPILLPAEDCGNGDGFTLDFQNCNLYASQYCNNPPDPCTGGILCIKGCASSNNSPIAFYVISTDTPGNCLEIVKDWQCCAKLNLADARNVIRRNFNDAWVFGTAYLFQFKYKSKFNRRTGELKKQKFCGPGAYQFRNDNYKNNNCCLDAQNGNECGKCLVRGQNKTESRNYAGIKNYHEIYHNEAVDAGKCGSVDINDLIYCNALMSTKIVSLGRIEMCPETLEGIENSILGSQALQVYQQSSNFYTGTFYESGWDTGYWIQELKETSYNDPREVLLYLINKIKGQCEIKKLFGTEGTCHEYETIGYNDGVYPYFFMKEVSKVYADVVTSIDTNGYDVFNPNSVLNPIAQSNAIDSQNDSGVPPAYGGFEVNLELANRFSPCGGGTDLIPGASTQHCTPYTNNGGSWNPPYDNGEYSDLSSGGSPLAFDYYSSFGSRSQNPNVRNNIPYYYFGINPGKTALNKLKNNFFVQK